MLVNQLLSVNVDNHYSPVITSVSSYNFAILVPALFSVFSGTATRIRKMRDKIDSICENALAGNEITRDQALFILSLEDRYLMHLLSWTDRMRQINSGPEIDLCSVINARSGGCTEDCSFCSQSVHYSANIGTYPLLSIDALVEGAKMAKSSGASKFCLATSGNGIRSSKDLEKLCIAIRRICKEAGIGVCATLGALTREEMAALKEAGLTRFHHNLETAEAYFPKVCSTHTYRERVEEVHIAKDLGLSTCSGGIFGIGESLEHRVDLAFELKALEVDSIPVNFLMPVQGTPLEGTTALSPFDGLRIIALFRILMPQKELRVCGGRISSLHDLHPLIFSAGANGMMIGNYLTKDGRRPVMDLQMLSDLGLRHVTTI